MTSAAKIPNRTLFQKGFTLLEMMIALVVTMMIVGSAMGLLYYNRDETQLNEMTSNLEVMAKRARAIASLQQRPYALEFTSAGVQLMPYAEAVVMPEDRGAVAFRQEQSALAAGSNAPGAVRDQLPLREDMRLQLMLWANNDWRLIGPRDRYVWRFDPNGISEPLGVRVLMENGNWMAVRFHPLTASIDETEYSIE